MSRDVRVLPSTDLDGVRVALAAALANDGPALLVADPAAPEPSTPRPTAVPRHVALVVETSGSTGVPKRVGLSADALLAHAAASAAALAAPRPGGTSQWLLALPTHYIAGAQVLVRSIVAGTDPVLLPPGPFDASRFAEAAERMTGDARFVSLVPVQLARLLDASDADPGIRGTLARFDGVLLGGQALPAPLRARAESAGVAVTTTYGSSETGGGCVYDGVPLGPVRARSVDGMLELGGPVLADGYVDDDERTQRAFAMDGDVRWFRTGDLGDVDDDGRVRVHGRADDVIVSGGEKVLLGAVERVVRELPGLEHAVVVAAPDEEWGTVPVVVADGAAAPGLEAVRASVRQRLGRAAAPARVVVVDRMPMLASGKPDRVRARALVEARDAADRRG